MRKPRCETCYGPEEHQAPENAPVGCLRSLQAQLNGVRILVERVAVLESENATLTKRLLRAEESLGKIRADLDSHTAKGKAAKHTPAEK